MTLKKIVLFTLAITLMIIGLLTSCQPTPDEEIVIARDNTEKEVYESSQENNEETDFVYETPEHITERYTIIKDSLDVEIDADVNMPDLDSISVAKVTSDSFTQERIDEFIKYFAEDGMLVSEYVMIKEDYDRLIVETKQGYVVDGEYVFDESSEEWLAQLLEKRENAPDQDIQEPITEYSIADGNKVECRIKKDGQITGYLRLSDDIFSFYTISTARSANENYYHPVTGELMELSSKEISMTEEEAIKIAQDIFEDLGIEGMAVSEIDKLYFTEDGNRFGDIEYGGYDMIFMREYGGMIPLKITSYSKNPGENYDVSPPIDVEYISISVDEYGNVTEFYWRNPIIIVETLTEHVDILSFEDIMTRFKESSRRQFGYVRGNMGDVMSVMVINKIEFKLMYLPIKNNPTEFMYAPCWVFVYKQRREYTDEQLEWFESQPGYTPTHWDKISESFLIFSAVDGASVSEYPSEWLEEIEDN